MAGRLKLGQILVNRRLLHPDQLAAALAEQQHSGSRLGMTLVRMGFVDEETLIRTLAGQLKLPVARIRGKRVSPDVLECIPVALAEKHRCLPLFFKSEEGERVLFVAMEDPSDADALDEIAASSGQLLRAVLVGPTELEEALQRHYHWASLTGESPDWLAAAKCASPGAGATQDPLPAEEDPGAAPESEPERDFDPVSGVPADRAATPAPPLGPPDPQPEDAFRLDPDPEDVWSSEQRDADTAPDLPGSDEDADFALEVDAEDAAPGEFSEGSGEDSPVAAALAADGDFDLDPDFELSEPAPAPPATPRSERGPRPDSSLDPRIILRALSQLLVEKGVITRDEFVQRLGQIAAQEGSRAE